MKSNSVCWGLLVDCCVFPFDFFALGLGLTGDGFRFEGWGFEGWGFEGWGVDCWRVEESKGKVEGKVEGVSMKKSVGCVSILVSES